MKILIIGAAGVGKTHLFHLLLNERPPDVRQSTPVMQRPVHAIQTALKSDSFLNNVTDEELYELLAHTVNSATTHYEVSEQPVDSSTASHIITTVPKPLPQESIYSQAQPIVHGKTQECGNYPSLQPGKEEPQGKYASNNTIPPQPSEAKQPPSNNPSYSYDNGLSEVEEQLLPRIANTKDATSLLDVNWVYLIDSGGQPQFHQLLPAFVHHTNLNIFVLRLCDKLSDHPTIEYYDERGTCISSPASLLTNKEILQCCAQATQTADQDGGSKLVIVGTHRDLEHKCDGETRGDKNKQLLKLLKPSMEKRLMYFTPSELIFPFNAKKPDEADKTQASELCQAIWSIQDDLSSQKVPLRWLVFHQEVQSLSKKANVVVLTFQQCSQVASRLHMVDDTAAALKFFSDLNVILYYQDILPNVIFTNPQVLFDIVSNIIKCVAFDSRKRHLSSMFVRANKEGIISEELFKKIQSSNIFKGVIEPKDLLNLMVHLKIASKCENKDEYFMPSLLKGLDAQEVQDVLSRCSDCIAPIALYNEIGWLKCGSFAFLITSLLSSKEWTLAEKESELSCVHSNCIQVCFNKSCTITMVDNISHIEVHINGDADFAKEACPEIRRCIMKACDKGLRIAFLCPCKHFTERHLAIPKDNSLEYQKVVCSKDANVATKLSELGAHADIWLKECGKTKLEVCTYLVLNRSPPALLIVYKT